MMLQCNTQLTHTFLNFGPACYTHPFMKNAWTCYYMCEFYTVKIAATPTWQGVNCLSLLIIELIMHALESRIRLILSLHGSTVNPIN